MLHEVMLMDLKKVLRIGIAICLALLAASGEWLVSGAAPNPLAPQTPEETASDGYGYTLSLAAEAWINANGGTQVSFPSTDDSYAGPFPIGFNFDFYESTFSHFYISTNGMVTFGEGSLSYQVKPIPWSPAPNNFIAPLWADLNMGFGKAYYQTFGAAPSRSTVIEWEIYSDQFYTTLLLNFEVVLYENSGNILVQYNVLNPDNMPERYTVGIEDADGVNGLQYLDSLTVGQDLRFVRPDASPRVKVLPRFQGGFTSGGLARYQTTVFNNGEFGSDRYNLQAISSSPGWQARLIWPDGNALRDTDSDGVVDTGLVAQGGQVNVVLEAQPPAGAVPGDNTQFTLTATSDLSPSKYMTATLQSAVPVEFAQVYVDGRGIRLGQIWQENMIDRPILDAYTGAALSMESTSQDNYLIAWEYLTTVMQDGRVLSGVTMSKDGALMYEGKALEGLVSEQFTDIFYKLANRFSGAGGGSLLTDSAQAINEPNVIQADARKPSIAIAPDGRIAVAWTLLKRRSVDTTFENHSNIYLAALSSSGQLLSGRYNVTQDLGWYTASHLYDNPNVAITGDSRYVACWTQQFDAKVRCALHTFNGTTFTTLGTMTVSSLPPDVYPLDLSLALLSSNRVLTTYIESSNVVNRVVYAAVNSSGSLTRSPTEIPGSNGYQPRAVQFQDGTVLIAWIEVDGRVGYAFLDNALNLKAGSPRYFTQVNRRSAGSLSVTLDRQNHAVLTWVDGDDWDYLIYALLTSDEVVRTPPMIFISDPTGDPLYTTSDFGFGNAGYSGVYQHFLPTINR
jgi:hypothetical protein